MHNNTVDSTLSAKPSTVRSGAQNRTWDAFGVTVPIGTIPATYFSLPESIKTGKIIPGVGSGEMATTISVLELGGTIASVPSPNGKIPALTFAQIVHSAFQGNLSSLPDLFAAPLGSRKYSFGTGKDSSELKYKHAMQMVDRLWYHNKIAGGTIVTCGTDRLADMARAAELMLKLPGGPIVFTGAQNTLDSPECDIRRNLSDAALCAQKLPPGVYLVFNGRIIHAREAYKFSSINIDAFRSTSGRDAGYVNALTGEFELDNSCIDEEQALWQRQFGREAATCDYEHDTNVFGTELNFGYNSKVLATTIANDDIHGAVIQIPGLGGFDSDARSEALKDLALKKPIIVATRCREGITDLGEYAVSSGIEKDGFISAGPLSAETVTMYLQWALGASKDLAVIRKYVLQPWLYEAGTNASRSFILSGSSFPSAQIHETYDRNPFVKMMISLGYSDPGDPSLRTYC